MGSKRGWLITGAILGLAAGAYLAYSEYIHHAHLPTPSIQAPDPFNAAFASTLAKYPGFGDCELYVWTDELPTEIDFELPGFQLSDIDIGRSDLTFVGAEHMWLIQISGKYENIPDDLKVRLAEGHEYSLTSCPTFPLLGRWGFETMDEERSNVWWKLEVLGLVDKKKDVPRHQIRTEDGEFSGFPLELPPGKEAYFIRPPIEGRPGVLLTGTFGKPD